MLVSIFSDVGINFQCVIQNLNSSQAYNFHILERFATKLCNFTNFRMLFNAVVINFPISTFFKILSTMQSVHFIKLQQACQNQACYLQRCHNMLKQLAASLWITSFDNQHATSVFTTCSRFFVNKLSQAMQTHPDMSLLTKSASRSQHNC